MKTVLLGRRILKCLLGTTWTFHLSSLTVLALSTTTLSLVPSANQLDVTEPTVNHDQIVAILPDLEDDSASSRAASLLLTDVADLQEVKPVPDLQPSHVKTDATPANLVIHHGQSWLHDILTNLKVMKV